MPAPNEIAASAERENEAIVLRYVDGWTTVASRFLRSC